MQRCDALVGKLTGAEGALLAFFLTQRAMPFVEYWQSAIDAADNGATLTIRSGDVPKWTDDE